MSLYKSRCHSPFRDLCNRWERAFKPHLVRYDMGIVERSYPPPNLPPRRLADSTFSIMRSFIWMVCSCGTNAGAAEHGRLPTQSARVEASFQRKRAQRRAGPGSVQVRCAHLCARCAVHTLVPGAWRARRRAEPETTEQAIL